MAAPSEADDPELAAAFLLGLMRQALDTFGCLASRPLFYQVRGERPVGGLREDVLTFTRRCLASSTTYRISAAQVATLLVAAAPAIYSLQQAVEKWAPGAALSPAAADNLTQLARASLDALKLHAPNGDWDAYRGHGASPRAGRLTPALRVSRCSVSSVSGQPRGPH